MEPLTTVPMGLLDLFWGRDANLLHAKMQECQSNLFSTLHDETELWAAGGQTVLEQKRLEPLDLEKLAVASGIHTAFFIISQAHSWDRLKITNDTFDKLMQNFQIFSYLMDIVMRFGIRIKDDGNTWNDFHSRRQERNADEVETCYMIHFVEKNNRATGDPWSRRQTGVYHRNSTKQSIWILIKPSIVLKKQLWAQLDAISRLSQVPAEKDALFHVMVIGFTLRNWPDYIADQTRELEKFEEKSLFSEVDTVQQFDYNLRFQDRQQLQKLHNKITRARAMLDGTVHLGKKIRALVDELLAPSEMQKAIVAELDDYDAEIKHYQRCLKDLQTRTSGTISLLIDILDFRNDHNSSSTLSTMKAVALEGEKAGKVDQRTSVNIRALTVVATMYLPASLLSAIFSSNLISVSSTGSYVVASHFWVFIVVLLPLITVTFVTVKLLEMVWKNRDGDGGNSCSDNFGDA